jgi:hypothetical protein
VAGDGCADTGNGLNTGLDALDDGCDLPLTMSMLMVGCCVTCGMLLDLRGVAERCTSVGLLVI